MPHDFLTYQKAIDEDVGDVLLHAAERMDLLLRDPTHFPKKKTESPQPRRTPLTTSFSKILNIKDIDGRLTEVELNVVYAAPRCT